MTIPETPCPVGIVPYRIELALADGRTRIVGARISAEFLRDEVAAAYYAADMATKEVLAIAVDAIPYGERRIATRPLASQTGLQTELYVIPPISKEEAIARIKKATLWVFTPQGAPTHKYDLQLGSGAPSLRQVSLPEPAYLIRFNEVNEDGSVFLPGSLSL